MSPRGSLESADDVAELASVLESELARAGLRRLLVASPLRAAPTASDALEEWLFRGARCDALALVIDDELALAGLNMKAVARRVRVRAFESIVDAHRWLSGGVVGSGTLPRIGSATSATADKKRAPR